jgi:hypothetical protein
MTWTTGRLSLEMENLPHFSEYTFCYTKNRFTPTNNFRQNYLLEAPSKNLGFPSLMLD